jgi:pantoate kinase
MVEQLLVSRDLKDFLKLSRKFADFLGLTKGICAAPLSELASNGIYSSVALFGETIFTLVPKSEEKKVSSILGKFQGVLVVSDIDTKGAILRNRDQ